MWHLYETLALYPDWQKHPEAYLARAEYFRAETEELTGHFLAKVKREGLKEITPAEVREMESGKHIRLLFEVTDGASSFPGSAREAVEELTRRHVEIQAIEIGFTNDEEARRIFHFVFGDHGTFLGSKTSRLPQELMQSVKRQMKTIF